MPDNKHLSNGPQIVLLGFGEAGQAFASGWKGAGIAVQIAAFDIKTNSPSTAEGKWSDYAAAGVTGVDTLDEVAAQGSLVFSLVTADQAEVAAEAAASSLGPGAWFFDCNSCSPGAKRRNAQRLEGRGINYIDTAVMAPVHPALHRTPLLLSGPRAGEARDALHALDMKAAIAGGEVGRASATKMIRSIMVKGIEALTLECILAGRRAGVDEAVLASLDASMPGWNWPQRAAYNLERATTHGIRRAAEMREVERTLDELGLPAHMSQAIVEWQALAGSLRLDLNEADADFAARADLMNDALSGAARAAE
ncbi:NAD(P)-dependent oxidoreductase [Vannielia litorea]|uniref:3-hydroxyisobutyrate dehydrogenase n=1 Tax=Vannielia litorea TaxID=1217970 RepID=A0A1N6G6B5_9RHOB|nr:DUF1932 domain-containing protein [Vannielia litorea]SIO03063.1 3-hydroxyisobutyrate dehydrogenase [Vannielia litorea]